MTDNNAYFFQNQILPLPFTQQRESFEFVEVVTTSP